MDANELVKELGSRISNLEIENAMLKVQLKEAKSHGKNQSTKSRSAK